MTQPLVATKLYVPTARAGLVARERLLLRLEEGAGKRLTLVSAPAGFGKTTLLASWLAASTRDRTVAWLSLDAADSEPTLFWAGVAAALDDAISRRSTGEPAQQSPSPNSADVTVSALLNDLTETTGEVLLILDDYHLADRAEVAAGMTFLVDHLPPNAHLVLCTRADPDLSLARWRAQGELLEIRAGDLRFTPSETATYLEGAISAPLTGEQVDALENRTEGWIAALQLAAISLQGRADVAAFISGFAGDNRFVVDYLVEEVLAQQPATVRDFLLRSAVLDRLSTSLCNVVLEREDSDTMLRILERSNLFLVALDDTREWYRYHQLFADVLRARLSSEHPDLVPLLHERASHWFEEHDLADPAIRHAVTAGRVDRAAALVEAAMPAVRRHRQEALASSWLRELPEAVIARSPALAVLSAGLLLVAGEVEAVRARLDDADRALATAQVAEPQGESEAPDLCSLRATVAIYRASLAQAQGDTAGTALHARRALDIADPQDHLSRGGAAGFLALAAWAEGDVEQALEMFTQAVDSLHIAGNLIDELSGTVVLADLWRAAGRTSKARALCEGALRSADSTGEQVGRAAAELHVALAELDIEAGELDSARLHLQTAAEWVRRAALTESVFRSFVAEALLARAHGEFAEAHELLDEAQRLYRPGFFPDLRPIPALRARLHISEGRLHEASEWARERGLSVVEPADHLREFEHLTLVRLLLAKHRHRPAERVEEVLTLLDRLGAAAQATGRTGSLVEIRVLAALTLEAQGRRSEALVTLASAWEVAAEPESHIRIFLDEGEPMIQLLHAARNDTTVGHHARRLTGPAGVARTLRGDHGRPAEEQLSDREMQVLIMLDSELGGPDIARALFISPNTLRTHTKHIFTKLGVSSRRAAVLRARERRLMPPDPD